MGLSFPEVLAAALSVGTLWAIPRLVGGTARQQFEADARSHMQEVADALSLKDDGKALRGTVDYQLLYERAQQANQHIVFPLRVAAVSIPFVVVFDGSRGVLATVIVAISLSVPLAPHLPVHPVMRLFKKRPAARQLPIRISELVLASSLVGALVVGFFR